MVCLRNKEECPRFYVDDQVFDLGLRIQVTQLMNSNETQILESISYPATRKFYNDARPRPRNTGYFKWVVTLRIDISLLPSTQINFWKKIYEDLGPHFFHIKFHNDRSICLRATYLKRTYMISNVIIFCSLFLYFTKK